MAIKYTYDLGTKSAADKGVYGTGSTQFSTSGSTSGNSTTNWRIHIQNVEVMYERVTQYKTTDGTVDFNYIDCNYTIEASREHIYLNASAGDMTQYQQLAGVTRREVRTGDSEVRVRQSGNVVAGKMPGAYDDYFDVSGNVNSTVLDILVAAKASCPQFELNLVDL